MKYRKKPIIIEAEQWFPGSKIEGVESEMVGTCTECPVKKFYIKTLEGEMEVSSGDYVITGEKGKKYPCKPDVFEISYEKVEE